MLIRIISYLVIALTSLCTALSYQLFVFPNQFAPAGLNGICTMIQHLSGISIGYLSLIINIPLAIAVYFLVNRLCAVRSMVYSLFFSLFTFLLERVDLSAYAYDTPTSVLLGPLVAGLISGACAVMLARADANTGGTEFIANILCQYHPELNIYWAVFALNCVVAVSSYFVYGYQMEPVLLCILYCYAASTVRDRMFQKSRSAIRCEIITQQPQELGAAIVEKLHHSATLIPATGIYSGKQTNILICVVNPGQMAALSKVVKSFGGTFASFNVVTNVIGNFKHLDNHGKPIVDIL